MEEVPTVRLSHLSDVEKRAYVLADNRLAEKAGWDREILAIELQALLDISFEVEITEFETGDIDVILDDARGAKHAPAGPEDQVPARGSGPAVSRIGDVWELGPHRLLCGDARDEAAYAVLLGDAKAEFVFTDHPTTFPSTDTCPGLAVSAMASGEMSPAEFTSFLETAERGGGPQTSRFLHEL